jgi:hypothetical protein
VYYNRLTEHCQWTCPYRLKTFEAHDIDEATFTEIMIRHQLIDKRSFPSLPLPPSLPPPCLPSSPSALLTLSLPPLRIVHSSNIFTWRQATSGRTLRSSIESWSSPSGEKM